MFKRSSSDNRMRFLITQVPLEFCFLKSASHLAFNEEENSIEHNKNNVTNKKLQIENNY